MSLSVARHGASALPTFSAAARSRVRALTASVARHPARKARAFTTAVRAEMEKHDYDYDIFTIGALYARERISDRTHAPLHATVFTRPGGVSPRPWAGESRSCAQGVARCFLDFAHRKK